MPFLWSARNPSGRYTITELAIIVNKYVPYMTVYLVISLPNSICTPYIYM